MTMKASCTMQAKNGTVQFNRTGSVTKSTNTSQFYSGCQSVGTSHVALIKQSAVIATGGVSNQGHVLIANISSSGDALIGALNSTTFVPLARCRPGEFCLLPIKLGVAIYAQSSTGTVILEHTTIEG